MGILNGIFGKNDDHFDKYKNNLGETDDEVEEVKAVKEIKEVKETSSDIVIEPQNSRNGIDNLDDLDDLDENLKLFGEEDNLEDKKEPASVQPVQTVEAVNVKPDKPDRMFRFVIFIDGTYSFTTIFKKVYVFLDVLTGELENVERKGNIGINYELVVHYEGDVENLYVKKCDSKEGFIKELGDVIFRGGADNGEDYMFSTIKRWGEEQKIKDNKTGDNKTEDAIFYFTDSKVIGDTENNDTGVKARFVRGYYHKESQMPAFQIVDREGEPVPEENHRINKTCIDDLVKMNENEMKDEIKRMVDSLLNDMSANG